MSPNEKYAALVAVAGYVPVALSAQEYIGLLPSCWRVIGETGVRIARRSYDSDALNPLRGQRSGVAGRGRRWQVHHDPYDVTRVWVRDHWNDAWVMAPWRHLSSAPAPFADAAWRHARDIVARRGADPVTETGIAQAVTGILQRAATGPEDATAEVGLTAAAGRKDRKKAARARAATPDRRAAPTDLGAVGDPEAVRSTRTRRPASPQPKPEEHPGPGHGDQDEGVPAVVVPLEIFDARREARRPW